MNTNNSSEMSTRPLSERVMSRIEEEHIMPRPYWQFAAKNWGVWAFSALIIVLGAFAGAALLFELVNLDWHFNFVTKADWLFDILKTLPLAWLILFLLF